MDLGEGGLGVAGAKLVCVPCGYHGVNEGLLLLDVEDNGVGLTPFKLSKIQAMLAENAGEPILNETGFGLDNVNKRIKLYYGEQYGLSIQSHYRAGTQVTVAIPKQPGLKEQNELEQMV